MASPRLAWRRTWPNGDPDDFTAYDPDRPMMHARIYRSHVADQVGGQWSWAVGEQVNLGTGTAMTARAAALEAEAAWFAYREAAGARKGPGLSS